MRKYSFVSSYHCLFGAIVFHFSYEAKKISCNKKEFEKEKEKKKEEEKDLVFKVLKRLNTNIYRKL